jgi:hypothetical protein
VRRGAVLLALSVLQAAACSGPHDDATPPVDTPAAGAGGSAGGAGASAGGATPSIPPGCNGEFVQFDTTVPTVLFLLDRSSSMFDLPYGTYSNRWEPVKEALVGDGVHGFGVIGEHQASVRFGLLAYTGQQVSPNQCPLAAGADTPIALNAYAAIQATYDAVSYDPILDGGGSVAYKGETPTGAAIDLARGILVAFAEPGPKHLVVVTDGQPDTCGVPDPQCGQDDAVRAAQAATAAGIVTSVVGVEMTDLDATRFLTDLANAGTGQPVVASSPNAECEAHLLDLPGGGTSATYEAIAGDALPTLPQDPSEVAPSVARLVAGMRECSIDLTRATIDTALAELGAVELQGRALAYGDPDGWRMASPTRIELSGIACETFQNTPAPVVRVSFPCEALL